MLDETSYISAKTWTRAVDSINKDGYSDGFVDGQKLSFQTSFDLGYGQGLHFGLELGFQDTMLQLTSLTQQKEEVHDAQRNNCQICINNNQDKQNVGNLFNTQKEKNEHFLKNNLARK